VIAAALSDRVERATGARVLAARPVSGGSIADAFDVDLADGRRAFLKTHESLAPEAFAQEAAGLAWLREANAVRVPDVLAVGDELPGFLLLERIDVAPRASESLGAASRAGDEAFGRALASLHRFGAPSFGLASDNHLATLPQDNTPGDSWATFYRDQRIRPLTEMARTRGLVSPRLAQDLARLCDRMETLVGHRELPSRLHGDLWGGNRLVDTNGDSWLVDPAVYAGHREIDLAMMRLFGGFSARVFDAYAEAFPLAAGHEPRVALYQIYPLLAHVVMFGAGYVGQVEDAVASALER
jgi:fructosamine-3-kinase